MAIATSGVKRATKATKAKDTGQDASVTVNGAAATVDGTHVAYRSAGLDVDFEGHSLSLNTGDTDFKNPTSPVIVNLISALKSLKQTLVYPSPDTCPLPVPEALPTRHTAAAELPR